MDIIGREPGTMNSRSLTVLDDLVRLGMVPTGIALVAVMGQPGDLVLHCHLAGRLGPLHDDLKAICVIEQAGIK